MTVMAVDNFQVLGRLGFFSGLSAEELQQVARLVVVRRYRAGMFIFMEGEPGEGLHFVRSGRVKIAKILPDGREQILRFLGPGEIFAEVLLFDNGPCPATAEAVEASEIGLIRQVDMERLLWENPGLTLKILQVMAKRLRAAQEKVQEMALRDVGGRLAGTLLRLSAEQEDAGGLQGELRLNQQELAGLIGSSRETVARLMSDLKRRGVVEVGRGRIRILNRQELARLIQ